MTLFLNTSFLNAGPLPAVVLAYHRNALSRAL